MYKHFSRPKTRSSSYVAIITVAGFAYAGMMALSSQKTEGIDSRVFVEGVTIHLSHNAPPVAALEDLMMEDEFGDEQIPKNIPKVALLSGLNSMNEIANQILAENLPIHKDEFRDVYTPTNEAIQMQTADVQNMRTQPIVAQASHVQNIDLKSVGVTREELLNALFIPMINHDPSVINRGGQYQPSAHVPIASNQTVIAPHKSNALNAAALLADQVSNESFAPRSDPAKQVTINGAIEMDQGLAFTSPKDRIVVYREDKGQQIESGIVWTKEGRFEIAVGSTSGLLVAELRTQTGEVLGTGRATMDRTKILIRLTPTSQGLVGRVVAANSSDEFDGKPIKSAKLMVDMIPHEFISEAGGRFSDPNLVNQSTMILKSQRPGFLPGITIASAGDENLIPMYSNKMVTQLLSLQSNSNKINNPEEEAAPPQLDMKDLAIVWGRITKNGEAVPGGQVEIVSSDQNLKAVYFNKMMIPDLSLTSTSSNGYYAFVGVNPGVQSLQVTYQAGISEPSIIPADANSISQLNLDVAKTKEASLMVFDGFHTDKSLPASILRIGQSSGIDTDARGQATIKYADGTGLMILDVDAGQEYELMRLTLNRNRNTIYAPVVSQAWFEELRKQAGLDVIAYTGSIMGFIQSDRPYKAAFGEKVSETTKIVYFNSRGEMIKGDAGVPGGGFVVFNAPEGLLTVSVLLLNSEKILTQTAFVDRGVVSVFSHWFH